MKKIRNRIILITAILALLLSAVLTVSAAYAGIKP